MTREATIEVTVADYVAANRDWWRRAVFVRRNAGDVDGVRGARRRFRCAGDRRRGEIDGLAIGLWGFGRGLRPRPALALFRPAYLLLPRRARRLYAQNKAFHAPTVYGWSDAGLSIKSVYGAAVYPWNFYHRWTDGRSAILLFITDTSFHIIPRRTLSVTQTDEIRALLLEHGPAVR